MCYLITSYKANEGKSTVSKEIVKILRSNGYKVCLIDGDFYKNRKESEIGLTDYLTNKADISDILKGGHIQCGTVKVYSFNGDRLITLLNYLKEEFDFIFIDSAPYNLFFTQQLLTYVSNVILIKSNKYSEVYNDYLYSKNIYEVETIFKK